MRVEKIQLKFPCKLSFIFTICHVSKSEQLPFCSIHLGYENQLSFVDLLNKQITNHFLEFPVSSMLSEFYNLIENLVNSTLPKLPKDCFINMKRIYVEVKN